MKDNFIGYVLFWVSTEEDGEVTIHDKMLHTWKNKPEKINVRNCIVSMCDDALADLEDFPESFVSNKVDEIFKLETTESTLIFVLKEMFYGDLPCAWDEVY